MRMLALPRPGCCIIHGPRRVRRPTPGVCLMRLFHPRGAYATPLAVALAALMLPLSPVARGADATPAVDLSEYRTVATAQQATPAALVGAERRPGYLGVNAEPD